MEQKYGRGACMRVALFVHCFFPEHFYGTETYTLELARNLRSMGHDAVVVSALFPGEPGKEKMVTYYEYEDIPVYCIDKNYLPDTRIKDTYYRPEMYSVLKDILRAIKPDIVHVTHLVNHTAALLEAAEDLDLPIIASCTDFFGFCYNNKLEAADGSLCEGPNARRTNCLACLLKAVAQTPGANRMSRLAGKYPFSLMAALILNSVRSIPGVRRRAIAGKVLDIAERPGLLLSCYSKYGAVIAATKFLRDKYIGSGLNVPVHEIRFGVDIQRQAKRQREKDQPIIFGFIGQIAPHKGTAVLVDAFCRLPKGKAQLHIYGAVDQFPQYVGKMKKRANGFDVMFRGTFTKEKMSEVLAGLDFLCIPSVWFENSPLVLLNALASHTPVITSDVEGMTEFVEEGKNGYIFARGDGRDLERVLRTVVADPGKARALVGTTNYHRTTKMMMEDVLHIYSALLHTAGK